MEQQQKEQEREKERRKRKAEMRMFQLRARLLKQVERYTPVPGHDRTVQSAGANSFCGVDRKFEVEWPEFQGSIITKARMLLALCVQRVSRSSSLERKWK